MSLHHVFARPFSVGSWSLAPVFMGSAMTAGAVAPPGVDTCVPEGMPWGNNDLTLSSLSRSNTRSGGLQGSCTHLGVVLILVIILFVAQVIDREIGDSLFCLFLYFTYNVPEHDHWPNEGPTGGSRSSG